MCDRTKAEVLARELCIEFWAGNHNSETVSTNLTEFIEDKQSRWLKRAERIVETLNNIKS